MRHKDYYNVMKKQDGITLIVLIVTIIVLIILTGVSINLALGDNGIIGIAKEETSKYAQAVANDQAELGELENLLKAEHVNYEAGGGSVVENTETGGGTEETVVGVPKFSYTGDYEIVNDDDTAYTKGSENWKVKFYTSGTLVVEEDVVIDVFLVGGGRRWRKSYELV